MKLIWLLGVFAVTVCGQKFTNEEFLLPPQIQKPTSSMFTSDSSIYLQPESQTTNPYFTMSDIKNIPLNFIHPTGTKVPSVYSTALPIYLSSTLTFDNNDNNEEHNESIKNKTYVTKQIIENHLSQTLNNNIKKQTSPQQNPITKRMTDNQKTPETLDIKSPTHVTIGPKNMQFTGFDQNPASRRMMMKNEIQRNDQGFDHIKESSFHNAQYVGPPKIFISSTTTEPAIPILRLSNEMDLDGSFSYEALGADQTHYVQHSHMENMGTDQEEQVVEGSYSYVGDNGRTYTVHYIADSNGFRATGDHLPVPPPVPEIIQRSVQYNLAEEAKRPPHLKSSWENDNKEYDIQDRNNHNILPPRGLFTGKTPEAFSFGFSQDNHSQNNLHNTASLQNPSKPNYDLPTDQSKNINNQLPISPHITFLASKGIHNPSTSSKQPTKVSNEKSPLPQLVNYEAEIKDSDQEINKALWRWQYGINSNENQSPKNSISRSFTEGDDVVINFNEMTPEQYTHMIQDQVLSQHVEENNQFGPNNWNNPSKLSHLNQDLYLKKNSDKNRSLNVEETSTSTEKSNAYSHQIGEIENYVNLYSPQAINNENLSYQSEIITRHNFIPPSQVATQTYNFDDVSFETTKILNPNGKSDVILEPVHKIIHKNTSDSSNFLEITTTAKPYNTHLDQNNNHQFYYKNNQENTNFKTIIHKTEKEFKKATTESSVENMISENVFLRNFLKTSKNDVKVRSATVVENKNQKNNEFLNPIQPDKEPKSYQYKQTSAKEVKIVKAKPLDINNILNYVVLKNHFESTKTKPNNKSAQENSQSFKEKYIPFRETSNIKDESSEDDQRKQLYDYNQHQQQQLKQHQELQGLIKNYKVLQRQKNNYNGQLQPEVQKHIKAFHTQSLPPLGRAGPSMKSYLPPTYLYQ